MSVMETKAQGQIEEAYKEMAKTAKYRPAAPSDGFGNITAPVESLDLNEEAGRYAKRWWDEEDSREYSIGVPSWEGRKALIFVIEAARNICGVQYRPVLKLLEAATKEVKNAMRERKRRGLRE